MARDYMAEARKQITAERAARAEAEITDRATQLRLKDERELQLATLRAFHGLRDGCTLRQLADAVIAYDHAWRSYVVGSASSGARGLHILDPENSGFTDQATIDALLSHRDRLRKAFDAKYAQEAAARLAQPVEDSTDSATPARAHNMVAA